MRPDRVGRIALDVVLVGHVRLTAHKGIAENRRKAREAFGASVDRGDLRAGGTIRAIVAAPMSPAAPVTRQ
jgi:hypothetical protein